MSDTTPISLLKREGCGLSTVSGIWKVSVIDKRDEGAAAAAPSSLLSITDTFQMPETVDKPHPSLFSRDIGVVSDIAFSTVQFNYRFQYKCENNNSNYYNPNSHSARLLGQQLGILRLQCSKKFHKRKKQMLF